MDENGKIWLPALCMTVILLLSMWGFTSYYSSDEKVEVDLSSVINAINALEGYELSEEQISLLTQRIVAEFPEMKDLNNEQVRDLWEDLYSVELEELELSALEDVGFELEEDEEEEYEKLIKFLEEALLIEIDEDELEVYEIDEDETVVEVITLGFDEESSEVNVHIEFKIRYEDVLTDTTHKDRVYVDAVVLYEEEEDPDVELVYSI